MTNKTYLEVMGDRAMIEDLKDFIKYMKRTGTDLYKKSKGEERYVLEGYLQALDEIQEFIDDYES